MFWGRTPSPAPDWQEHLPRLHWHLWCPRTAPGSSWMCTPAAEKHNFMPSSCTHFDQRSLSFFFFLFLKSGLFKLKLNIVLVETGPTSICWQLCWYKHSSSSEWHRKWGMVSALCYVTAARDWLQPEMQADTSIRIRNAASQKRLPKNLYYSPRSLHI